MAIPLNVLLVEDNEDETLLLVRELEAAGYEVSWKRVETAAEMSAALTTGGWNLVLSDYAVPGFGAPAALQLLRKTGLDLPFIIVSGTVGEASAVEAMQAGAHDYILKENLRRLAPAVGRELEQARSRRARRTAEETSLKLLQAVEQTQNAILMTDLKGTITYVNPAFERIYGYSKKEAIGRNPRILKSGRHDAAFYESFWRKLSAGESTREEMVNRARDGRLITVEVSVSPVRDAAGARIGFIGVQNDITERNRAEKALRESEQRFRSLIENSKDLILVVIAPSAAILYASPSVERAIGYLPADVTGTSALQYVHPEDAPRLAARLEEILAKETPTVPISFRVRHRDGSWRIFEAVGNNRVADPAIRGIILNARDVTEMKQSEEARRASEERYRLLFEGNPQPTWVFDEKTLAFLAVNEAACKSYGYSREELLAMTIADIRPAEEVDRLRGFLKTERSGHHESGIWRHRKKDATVIEAEIRSSPIEFGGRKARLVLALDVTERRRLEEQLLQAQKMEAIGQLAGGIAHDFNNLLTAILGYADLAARSEGRRDAAEAVEEIRKAGERAADLTRQLLAFSRKQVFEPKVLDLNALVSNLEKMLRRLIGEDVELATKLDPVLGPVRVDASQIEQVIVNLAVNARDAMPDGGTLTIETQNVALDETYAREHVSIHPGEYVMFAITDTGVGMSAETQKHIFEPFFTTKERGKGTGLGLSTVYGTVKQSGGYIWVYSELGRGTSFKVYLPRVEAPVEPVVASRKPERASGGSETVLLVEDTESVRKLTRRILDGAGYTVLEAGDGAAAVETAQQHTGRIHLLLTDVVMPLMGGSDLASRIRSLHPEAKLLFMSGYTDEAVVRHGLVSEGRLFLQKPFTPQALLARVREVLDGQP
jgi:PAS domain S-box-containing protein